MSGAHKAKIAQQFSSSMDSKVRKIADVGMQTMNAAELKASATGNPYALYYVMLDQELKDLKRAKRTYENGIRIAQRFVNENTHESINQKAEARLDLITQFEILRDATLSPFTISDEENNRLKKQLKNDFRYSSQITHDFTQYRGINIKYEPFNREFFLEVVTHKLHDKVLKYSASEMDRFSPRVLFKDIDMVLNIQLPLHKQEILAQMELEHKDLERFSVSQFKPFIHQDRLTALEKDITHCQNIIKELQQDSSYTENWIPDSIKDSIKNDMLPKGYVQSEINNNPDNLVELEHEKLCTNEEDYCRPQASMRR